MDAGAIAERIALMALAAGSTSIADNLLIH
jgi:hypothetical protein